MKYFLSRAFLVAVFILVNLSCFGQYYDFDYSGIVNAFYAIPGEHLPIENVRQRYYMGACREMTEYEEAFKVFREKREEIELLFKNSEYLTENAKKAPLNYIDEFYKIIDNKGAVKSIILAYCR